MSYYYFLFSFHEKNLEKLKGNELSIFVQIIMESFFFCSLVEILCFIYLFKKILAWSFS